MWGDAPHQQNLPLDLAEGLIKTPSIGIGLPAYPPPPLVMSWSLTNSMEGSIWSIAILRSEDSH